MRGNWILIAVSPRWFLVISAWPFAINLEKCLCPEDLVVAGSGGDIGVSKACGLSRVEMCPFLRGGAKNPSGDHFPKYPCPTCACSKPHRPPVPGNAVLPVPPVLLHSWVFLGASCL